MLATDYAEYYDIAPQGTDESDSDFRLRVSNELKGRGHLIEGLEAYHDQRYESSDIVMDGLFGEIGRVMDIVPQYRQEGTHSDEGDKVAAGAILRHGEEDTDPFALLIAAMLR